MRVMSISKKLLMAKARGFTISIEKMDEKHRLTNVPGDYADDYNKLLAETRKHMPMLEPLLPPVINKYGSNPQLFGFATFSVVDTYCEQIYQLVAESDVA